MPVCQLQLQLFFNDAFIADTRWKCNKPFRMTTTTKLLCVINDCLVKMPRTYVFWNRIKSKSWYIPHSLKVSQCTQLYNSRPFSQFTIVFWNMFFHVLCNINDDEQMITFRQLRLLHAIFGWDDFNYFTGI